MISVDDVRRELKKYFIHVISFTQFHGGTSGNTYIVKSDKKRYVLKLYKDSDREWIKNLLIYLKEVNKKKKITIDPLNKKVLEIGDMAGYFYEFFPGGHYSRSKVPKKLFSFGKIVGEFSQQTRNISSRDGENIHIHKRETIKEIKDLRNSIIKKPGIHKEVVSLVDLSLPLIEKTPIRGKYREQLVHGDLHMDNVFYNKKVKEPLIADVDGLHKRIISKEITVIISYELTNSISKNKKIIKEILRGDESMYKLTKEEKRIIPQLMVLRKYGEILWLVGQYKTKKLSFGELKTFVRESLKQLKIITNQYSMLGEIFKKI